MKTFLKALSIFLLAILSIGALYGSWIFISDPSGAKFDMTTDLLCNTPFGDFLIPGIILLVVHGLLPLIIIYSLLRRTKYAHWLLIVQGCLLIGWLTIEILFNMDFFIPLLHYPLYSTGILFILMGYLLMRRDT